MDLKEFLQNVGLYRKYCGYVWSLNTDLTPDSMPTIDQAFQWYRTTEGRAFWKAVADEYSNLKETN